MASVQIRLDTSDFSVELRSDGRVDVLIYGDGCTASLDLDPEVAQDFARMLLDPEDPSRWT